MNSNKTPDSTSLSSPPRSFKSFCGFMQVDLREGFSTFDIIPTPDHSSDFSFAEVLGDFGLLSFVDGDAEVTCWSNACR